MLSIPKIDDPSLVEWFLPPSKSHMIRWIVMASQSNSVTELEFSAMPGRDIESMAGCMEQMGVSIERDEGRWTIQGKIGWMRVPNRALNCGNSATSAKIATSIAACLGTPICIDGDLSLRNRDFSPLTSALVELGCEITSERLPYTVTGPLLSNRTKVDESFSSQTLTGMILASPGFTREVEIELVGEAVSRWYRDLTIEICRSCGWPGKYHEKMTLGPWIVETPERVKIPEEVSLLPISLLFDRLHGTKSLNQEIGEVFSPIIETMKVLDSTEIGMLDLRDFSDLITPVAAIMAIGSGGEITGAEHARGKETDRILSTVRLLSSFGIVARETKQGLSIPGGQNPTHPEGSIDCESDHRLAMTAMVLATAVGGAFTGHEVCEITHPGFVEMITSPIKDW